MSSVTIDTTDPGLHEALREILKEMEVLSVDIGPEVQRAVQAAREEPLDPETAERLYTRIVTILRKARGGRTGGTADAQEVAGEVRRMVAARRAAADPWGAVPLETRNGLTPHLVVPVPVFNGKAVPMWEGYVDIDAIDLWKGNHRVELEVAEFRERYGREPDDDELLQLVQGELHLPSLTKKDPFKISGLAGSIARKGVERPPILTSGGQPKDGNRRLAAAKKVRSSDKYSDEERERARWVKVWVAPPGTTEDLFEAIVVALNFEEDYKEQWPEYVKARLVVAEYRKRREDVTGAFTAAKDTALKRAVAEQFAIKSTAVTRYLRMVQWAEDFETYHVEESGRDAAAVRYKADEIFQWFYEIQAGRGAEKVVTLFDEDDDLRARIYDLMFEVMDSGTQVRSLYKVMADPQAREHLDEAHRQLEKKDREAALDQVRNAVTTADQNTAARKKIGFESFLRTCVDRLGSAPPDNWLTLDSTLLRDLERVFLSSVGVIEGQLVTRGERSAPAPGGRA
jgi:hypothetical protein